MNLTTPRTGAILLTAAAPVLLAAELIRSDHSQEKYAAQLADVARNPGPELTSAILFLIGGVLLVVAAIGLGQVARTGRGATLVQVGAALLGVGGLWMAAGRGMFEGIVYALAKTNPNSSVAALEKIGSSPGTAIFVPLLLALIIGPIVFALGLGRIGVASRWLAAVWVVALLLFLATETSKLGNLVGFGTMMGVLAAFGGRLLRNPGPGLANLDVR